MKVYLTEYVAKKPIYVWRGGIATLAACSSLLSPSLHFLYLCATMCVLVRRHSGLPSRRETVATRPPESLSGSTIDTVGKDCADEDNAAHPACLGEYG